MYLNTYSLLGQCTAGGGLAVWKVTGCSATPNGAGMSISFGVSSYYITSLGLNTTIQCNRFAGGSGQILFALPAAIKSLVGGWGKPANGDVRKPCCDNGVWFGPVQSGGLMWQPLHGVAGCVTNSDHQ